MAVYFWTETASGLLKKFDKAIDDDKITTWQRSDDRKYYTHKAKEWAKKAWFTPVTSDKRLTFNIVKPSDANVKVVVYGYYHGHLIETFLNHFDKDFSTGEATALPASGDNCG